MKPKHIPVSYAISALIFLVLAGYSGSTFDIAAHDTYIVVSNSNIFLWLSLVFAIYSGISWLMYRFKMSLKKAPVVIHLSLTFLGIITAGLIVRSLLSSGPPVYSDYSVYNGPGTFGENDLSEINHWLTVLVISIVGAQLIFFANVVYSFATRNRN